MMGFIFLCMLIGTVIAVPILMVLSILFDSRNGKDPLIVEMRRQRTLNYYNNPVVNELKKKD